MGGRGYKIRMREPEDHFLSEIRVSACRYGISSSPRRTWLHCIVSIVTGEHVNQRLRSAFVSAAPGN